VRGDAAPRTDAGSLEKGPCGSVRVVEGDAPPWQGGNVNQAKLEGAGSPPTLHLDRETTG
jgi:hypothetical protein